MVTNFLLLIEHLIATLGDEPGQKSAGSDELLEVGATSAAATEEAKSRRRVSPVPLRNASSPIT
jgi:hypothetical protein